MDIDAGLIPQQADLTESQLMDYNPIMSELLLDRPSGLTLIHKKQRVIRKTKDGLIEQTPSMKPLDYIAKPNLYVR
tara:strand:- start:601 stop:828 length:228 start_codon:yes stop_codon:yes gene_type:complete